MKILAVGGGSGGHVTPVVAVLRELKTRQPDVEIHFWCDRKFAPQAKSILSHFDAGIPIATVHAGKLRRYHTLSKWRQLTRPSIVFPNLRDMFLVFVGFIESFFRLLIWRPDVVFTKGGFVCLPVGLAARLLRIPLVIHDSDAHPGLTNRILAKWATAIATGAPLHNYNYPKNKTHYIGIPIAPEFHPLTPKEQEIAKAKLGFDTSRPLIVVTGGGLGARRLNDSIVTELDQLLAMSSLLLVSGTGQYEELKARLPDDDSHFQLKAFISEGMPQVLGAADIVIARAGATTIMELAALMKPTILVPNAYLTGGHQLKNAAAYAENGAVAVIGDQELEKDASLLSLMVKNLLLDPEKLRYMSKQFAPYAKPHAAEEMADMILGAVKKP